MERMAAVCLVLACAAGAAQAQYSCRTGAGTNYFSDRPCSKEVNSTSAATGNRSVTSNRGITYYGPTDADVDAQRYQPPRAALGEAPPHIKYMSPRCSSLHDALRTAPARGLKHETMAAMRKGYQAECAENESEAFTMLSKESGERNLQRRADQSADKQSRERAALHEQQCGESKRILVSKRARSDLTEGEKAELQRFEVRME